MVRKNKTVWSVVGILLVLFGITGTIPILINKEYFFGLPFTGLSVVVGVVLVAWSLSN
ncbi:MAG: hypothetical protein U9Q06_02065 [Nanoarchaeota archaeon]|nr:hypothetical protein [Nanoarchaeota archaeon]